jgi:hypothetical protein
MFSKQTRCTDVLCLHCQVIRSPHQHQGCRPIRAAVVREKAFSNLRGEVVTANIQSYAAELIESRYQAHQWSYTL